MDDLLFATPPAVETLLLHLFNLVEDLCLLVKVGLGCIYTLSICLVPLHMFSITVVDTLVDIFHFFFEVLHIIGKKLCVLVEVL